MDMKEKQQEQKKQLEDYSIPEQIELLKKEKQNLEGRTFYLQGRIDQLEQFNTSTENEDK